MFYSQSERESRYSFIFIKISAIRASDLSGSLHFLSIPSPLRRNSAESTHIHIKGLVGLKKCKQPIQCFWLLKVNTARQQQLWVNHRSWERKVTCGRYRIFKKAKLITPENSFCRVSGEKIISPQPCLKDWEKQGLILLFAWCLSVREIKYL